VRGRQPLRKLNAQPPRLLFVERALLQLLTQRHAVNQLHHQKVHAPFAAEVVDGFNTRMIQFGQGEGFVAETLSCGFVL
jgi:hypothetical protein